MNSQLLLILLFPLLSSCTADSSHSLGFVHIRLKCGPNVIPKKPCSISGYCEENICSDSSNFLENSKTLQQSCLPGDLVQQVIKPCPNSPANASILTFKPVTIQRGPKELFFRVYLHKDMGGLVSKDFPWARFRLLPFPDLPSGAWRHLSPLATNLGGIWMRLEAKIICSQHHYGENCATECHSDWRRQCLENGTQKCNDGWEGPDCSVANPCGKTVCEHGSCWHEQGIPHCDCDFGWRGELCDKKDPCATSVCHNTSCDVTADGRAVCSKDSVGLDPESDSESESSKIGLIAGASVFSIIFLVLFFLCGLLLFIRRRRRRLRRLSVQYRKQNDTFMGSFRRDSSGVYEDPDENHYSDSETGSNESYDRPGPAYSNAMKDEDDYDLSKMPYTTQSGLIF